MRALWLGMASLFLLVGCGQTGSVPALRGVGQASRLAAPAGAATFYVDGVLGNDHNDCMSAQRACKTIKHAVRLSKSGDTIIVAAAEYRENVVVQHSVRIIGAGADDTVVNGERRGSEFLIAFKPAVDVTIEGLTMRNGSGSGDGGAIYHCNGGLTLRDDVIDANIVRGVGFNGYGGAIYNCPGSTLTIVDSTVSNNVAEVGGAICNGGLLTIFNTTFSGNTARERRGGGAIFNYGVLHVANSTFSGNTAQHGIGGAIHNGELVGLTGGAQLDNDTFSGNTAALKPDPGGGIYNKPGTPIYVQNSIIANNVPQNCGGARILTEGFNLSSDESCALHGAGDLNGANPVLGPLQDNGGPTLTVALDSGSPAIDAGNGGGCRDWLGRLLATDQRGMPRPDTSESRGCDMGAFESQ